jgi:hypothetical protein
MARDRGFTYGGIMNVDVKITSHTLSSNKEGEETHYVNMRKSPWRTGLIPIMVKSTYCVWNDPAVYGFSWESVLGADPGGYSSRVERSASSSHRQNARRIDLSCTLPRRQ